MSSDTRENILNTAEKLFADRGFNVSVREIVALAEVNISAISYHFGSKNDLVLAVIERRVSEVNVGRLSRLENLRKEYRLSESELKGIPLRKIVEAFINPVFSMAHAGDESGVVFTKMLGRVMSNTNPQLKQQVFSMFNQVVKEFLVELQKSLPKLSSEVLASRFYFMVGAMAHTLMNQTMPEELAKRLPDSLNRNDSQVDISKGLGGELIDFLCGGLSA